MFVVKKGKKYYFGCKNGLHLCGERKALAKKYSCDEEFRRDFKYWEPVKKIYLK